MDNNKQAILVTGGAGFIGSTLANHLADHFRIVVVDDLSMGKLSNLRTDADIDFYEHSVTDTAFLKDLFARYSFNKIFHLAAVASVADSIERPAKTNTINFRSTVELLELAKQTSDLERFVFASSAAVYGDDPILPKSEDAPIRPLSPYSVDKFASERYTLLYHHLYGMPTAAVRFFNVYGPNQNPNSPYSGVISIMMDRFRQVMDGNTTTFTYFGDGTQTRDFVYVEDVIQALHHVATNNVALGRVFNVGTGRESSLLELQQVIEDHLGITLPTEFRAARAGDIHRSVASIEALSSIGYTPNFNLKEGINKYIEKEFLKNEQK